MPSSSHSFIAPPALKPGDPIGVMAPSTVIDHTKLQQGIDRLSKHGFEVEVHPQTYNKHGSSAGTPSDKAKALEDLLQNKDIKAVIAAGGGNHAGTFLSLLNYDLIRDNPKILCGFSDVTAILNAVTVQTGLITFHGPTLNTIGKDSFRDDHLEQLVSLLAGETNNFPVNETNVIRHGKTTGKLIGGNLSLISSLLGTPYQPDFDGSILFLEDYGDEMSRYARMLTHLGNAGVFSNIRGLIIGNMHCAEDTGSTPFGFELNDVIRDLTSEFSFPILTDCPFGHADDLFTLPIGALCVLDTGDKNAVHLTFERCVDV